MKHSLKIVVILLSLFFITQLIGLFVTNAYSPQIKQVVNEQGQITNSTVYNLPYGTEPPKNTTPKVNLISILIAIVFAVLIMFFLMRLGAERFIRVWFFVVTTLAIAITLNAIFMSITYASLVALIIAIPLSFVKIFKRDVIIHNLTELLIYPGIAAIFVPLFNIWTVSILLIFISLYDMYAVWHSGIMQKMAKYQIQKVKTFSGFFIPYMGKKEKTLFAKIKNKPSLLKKSKIKISLAILGGGDVVFPIILAGVVFRALGLYSAILISLGATAGLIFLFYISKKGKFYPAMPFITLGCFLALGLAFLI